MDELSDGQKEKNCKALCALPYLNMATHTLHRKEMQDLDLLPFVSFYRFPLHSSPFQLFGGWVNGQTLIKEKKCWTSIHIQAL